MLVSHEVVSGSVQLEGLHAGCPDDGAAFLSGEFQQVGATLADMDVALRASRQLVHHAARLKDRGLDNAHAVSAAKLHATEAACRVVDRCR